MERSLQMKENYCWNNVADDGTVNTCEASLALKQNQLQQQMPRYFMSLLIE